MKFIKQQSLSSLKLLLALSCLMFSINIDASENEKQYFHECMQNWDEYMNQSEKDYNHSRNQMYAQCLIPTYEQAFYAAKILTCNIVLPVSNVVYNVPKPLADCNYDVVNFAYQYHGTKNESEKSEILDKFMDRFLECEKISESKK